MLNPDESARGQHRLTGSGSEPRPSLRLASAAISRAEPVPKSSMARSLPGRCARERGGVSGLGSLEWKSIAAIVLLSWLSLPGLVQLASSINTFLARNRPGALAQAVCTLRAPLFATGLPNTSRVSSGAICVRADHNSSQRPWPGQRRLLCSPTDSLGRQKNNQKKRKNLATATCLEPAG